MNTDQSFNLLMILAGAFAVALAVVNREDWWKFVGVSAGDTRKLRPGFLIGGLILVVDNLLGMTGIVKQGTPVYLILYVLDGIVILGLILLFYRTHGKKS